MKEHIEFKTVQDLVDFALTATWAADERFKLVESNSDVYVDDFAGAQWEEEEKTVSNAFPNHYRYVYLDMDAETAAKIESDKKSYNAWREQHPKPRTRTKRQGYLTRSGGSYRSTCYWLGEDLFAQVYAVWTKKPRWSGSSYVEPVGSLKLKSLLSRLGRSEIGAQVKDAIALKELQTEVMTRNNTKKYVRSEADKFLTFLKERAGREGYPFGFGEGSPLWGEIEQLILVCDSTQEPIPGEN